MIFSIALADDKALGWTVDGLGPDANVIDSFQLEMVVY